MTFAPGGARSEDGDPFATAESNALWCFFSLALDEVGDAAGIPSGKRYGWHSFRRAFANALRDVPLRELKDLGGWKSERTVVAVYLRPDEQAQRTALGKLASNGQ
jgi:hypothetical protein